MTEKNDTIAAISTPAGMGGIAIIRISGPEAVPIALGSFKPARKGFPAAGRDFCFGKVVSPDGVPIDEALCLVMRGPKSYTGEDVAELQCHGGVAAARAVLSAVIGTGARQARRGEFSRRALSNGKMSLMKAESIGAMIMAKTEEARLMASDMMEGKGSEKAFEIRTRIVGLLARMEAELDWPDEMSDEQTGEDAADIRRIETSVAGLLEEAGRGRILTEGIGVAIIGRPNMGKSSLMNRLLGRDRAIVSHIPGTTRDTVEETANVEGIPIRFVDTAGIGPSDDPIVAAGIQRTRKAATASAVILYVVAYPLGLTEEDAREIENIREKNLILVRNKADLAGTELVKDSLPTHYLPAIKSVSVSAKTGFGIDELKAAIAKEAGLITEFEDENGPYSRWIACLEGCLQRLACARRAIDEGLPQEAACMDLREALYSIGELTGDVSSEDVIDVVFDSFCIGK